MKRGLSLIKYNNRQYTNCTKGLICYNSSSFPLYYSLSRLYSSSSNFTKDWPTAAGVAIGNEILNGKTTDTNTAVLSKFLWGRGIKLVRVETVPDDIDDIVETIQRLKEKVDYIFTSGGVGPTHDDMTYEAIAKAYGKQLTYHEPTIQKMAETFKARKLPFTEARRRMAYIPEGSVVIETPELGWIPLCVVEDQCFILPGIPELYSQLLQFNTEKLPKAIQGQFQRSLVGIGLWEGDIADKLTEIAKQYDHVVSIGSYPLSNSQRENSKDTGKEVTVVISIEGKNEDTVKEVKDLIETTFGGRTLTSIPSRIPPVKKEVLATQ